MIITLLGYMGSGKSTIGQQLAVVLGYDFIDLDNYIEAKEDASITEIFKNKGEIYFRKKENSCLKELLTQNKNIVLSLGGGTPCYANNMQLLGTNNVSSYYLKLTPLSLVDRLFDEKEQRPLINHLTTKEALQEFIGIHLFERQNYYQLATRILKTDNLSPKEIIEDIIKDLY
jgi:shikimate kinase